MIIQQRMSSQYPDDGVVVFLIGARINRWWKVHKWLPVARAMPRMVRELQRRPELGFLGFEAFGGRTTLMVQYWRSMKHLMEYARAKDSEHLPAWREFNENIGTNGDVGIWHEIYRVEPGHAHSLYSNMPPFGFGKVGALVPAHVEGHRWKERIRSAENAALPA